MTIAFSNRLFLSLIIRLLVAVPASANTFSYFFSFFVQQHFSSDMKLSLTLKLLFYFLLFIYLFFFFFLLKQPFRGGSITVANGPRGFFAVVISYAPLMVGLLEGVSTKTSLEAFFATTYCQALVFRRKPF